MSEFQQEMADGAKIKLYRLSGQLLRDAYIILPLYKLRTKYFAILSLWIVNELIEIGNLKIDRKNKWKKTWIQSGFEPATVGLKSSHSAHYTKLPYVQNDGN